MMEFIRTAKMSMLIASILIFGCTVIGATIKSQPTSISVKAPINPGSTLLGMTAAKLQAGQWAIMNKAGDGSAWASPLLWVGSDTILNYADKGLWDPVRNEIHFLGKGAGGAEFKMISYDGASNHWVQEPKPFWDLSGTGASTFGHGYEHSTINPVTGDVFWRQYNSSEIYKWARSTKTWSKLPAAPDIGIVGSLEYFPEAGGFTMIGAGSIYFYKESTGVYTKLASGLDMADGYHTESTYNPIHKVVIGGGGNGSKKMWKISSSLVVTPIASAPANVGIMASVFTVDPASGKYLLFTSGGSLYDYNVTTDVWSSLNASGVPIWETSDSNKIIFRAAVPVKNFGVIVFLTGYYNTDAAAKVYIYKHSN